MVLRLITLSSWSTCLTQWKKTSKARESRTLTNGTTAFQSLTCRITRIPEGIYDLKLRTHGGFHDRYTKKYGSKFHKGMIHVQNVPNFRYILWHTGNNDDHTAGCLLLGDTSQQNISKEGFIGGSTSAYKRVYPVIADCLEKGEEVIINYKDI